jgi:hypothetical protein
MTVVHQAAAVECNAQYNHLPDTQTTFQRLITSFSANGRVLLDFDDPIATTDRPLLCIYLYSNFEGSHEGLNIKVMDMSQNKYVRIGRFDLSATLCKDILPIDQRTVILI